MKNWKSQLCDGDVYDLLNMAKTKFSTPEVVPSGVLRRQDVSWRRTGAINSRYELIVKTLDVSFVEPNSSMDDCDFGRRPAH